MSNLTSELEIMRIKLMDNNHKIEQSLQAIANELKEIRKILKIINDNYVNTNIQKKEAFSTLAKAKRVLDNQ